MTIGCTRGFIIRFTVTTTLCGLLAISACSGGTAGSGSGGANATGGAQTSSSGGNTASGGANASSGGASASGGTTGNTGTGGIQGGGGTAATGGMTGTGGRAATGTGGAATGGTTSGTGGNAGATGDAGRGGASSTGGSGGAGGGGTNCAGRAISMSANQSGTATDTARARVVADLTTDLPIGNAARTVEFWAYIKTTDWVGEHNEIFEYGTTGTATAFGLDFGTNPVSQMTGNHATLNPYTNGGFNDDSVVYLGITSTSNQWVHIAMTWDQIALRTYVNGVLRIITNGTNGITALATAQSQLTIGCNDPIFNCFSGYFDEFRIWKVARSADDIMKTYNKTVSGTESDLVGYWKFDDPVNSATAADSVTTSGHVSHPGTLTAAATNQKPTFVSPNPPAPILCP